MTRVKVVHTTLSTWHVALCQGFPFPHLGQVACVQVRIPERVPDLPQQSHYGEVILPAQCHGDTGEQPVQLVVGVAYQQKHNVDDLQWGIWQGTQ